MKKQLLRTLCVLISVCALVPSLIAQTQADFQSMYQIYPKIPKGTLEVLAYSTTRIQNVQPVPEMTHHHGPDRFGPFALVENGEGIFKNTLDEVANFKPASVSKEAIKSNAFTQLVAVAAYVQALCERRNARSMEEMGPVFKDFCEISGNTLVDKYAQDLFLYEIYYNYTRGFEAQGISFAPHALDYHKWFNENTFKIISAPSVLIKGETITNGNEVYNPSQSPFAVRTADYGPALWVPSPNFSSRGTTAISAVTIHTTQGSYSGAISWFQNTASQVSAHYVLRSSDGQVTQCVLESNKAWHVGSENPYTIGLEHEGYVAQTGWYTTAMYNSSADLVKDICNSGYGILPTTCYSGAASSGINVLASSVKIKGHQHYPNQTHTDPGINWDWALYYNLINNVSCAAPTGLATSTITTTGATLTWAAVAGATSYTVEWKTAAATTWNTVNVTTTSHTLTGLTSATTYNWRVKANCSGFTNGANFTTNCIAPTGLATSAITTSGATLAWAAVTGATSYTVEWKTSAATTWTTASVTTNSRTLTGLTSATTYNWRVKANCGGYTTGTNFTTLSVSCATPTGLTSSQISTTTATLAWAAVSGATGYEVSYKTSAATTWTTPAIVTTTTYNVSGLAASTAYQWRVRTQCGTSFSAYTATQSFTTQASCWDASEANNSSGTSTTLTASAAKIGKICPAGDVDWYKVTTTAASSTIAVSLTQLPLDYDMELYVGGAYVTGSYGSGTANETITRTAQPAGTYYYRVYGPASATNALLDYRIAATVTTLTSIQSTTDLTVQSVEVLGVYPNPVSEFLHVDMHFGLQTTYVLSVVDLTGKEVLQQSGNATEGLQQTSLPVNGFAEGFYLLKVQANEEVYTYKFAVKH